MAPQEAALLPWCDIAIDPIGPWTFKVGREITTFMALTIINLVVNLAAEVMCLENKTATHTALEFDNTWLAHQSRTCMLKRRSSDLEELPDWAKVPSSR